MSILKFTKMHGIGNDYIYINDVEDKIKNEKELAVKLSNRHFGIGGDGIILIKPSNVADFRMQMLNADGSEAQMCGNGIRCVAKYIYDKNLSKKNPLTIETLAGIKTLKLDIKNDAIQNVTVDMGEPILDPKKIPANVEGEICLEKEVEVLDKIFKLSLVSMGNPHCVIYVDDVKNFDIEKYGRALENDLSLFPEKANIEFVEVVDRENLKMRVWERGSGETLACGTGASGVAVVTNLNKKCERKVNIHLLGGMLSIFWNEETNHVFLTGSATTVFEGEIEI